MSAIAPGLIWWFRLDGNFSDSSGRGYSITYLDSFPVFAPGRAGLCAVSDGVDDGLYAELHPTGADIPCSLCLWFKYPAQPTNGQRTVLYFMDGGSMYLTIDKDITGTYFQLTDAGPTAYVNLPGWEHLVVTMDGSTSQLYVNGNLVISTANSYLYRSIDPLQINYHSHGNKGPSWCLSDFQLYDRVLRPSEIRLIMSGGLPS